MKKSLKFLALFFAAAAPVFAAGELTLNPGSPTPGNRITLKYKPDEKLRQLGNVFAVVYSFRETSLKPVARQAELKYDQSAKAYVGEFKLDSTTVYGVVKVSDGLKKQDNNDGKFWDFTVQKSGKVVRSAFYRAAISYYGNMPQQAQRRTDFGKTMELLRKELELYPDNFQAKVALNSISYEQKKIDSAAYYKKVHELLASSFDNSVESFVLSAVRMYATVGMKEKGDSLSTAFVQKYPTSSLAEEQEVAALSALVQDGAKFPQAAKAFLSKFPANEYREQIQIAAITHLLNAQQIDAAEKFLEDIKFPSPMAYAQIARVYSAADSTMEDAAEVAALALEIARKPAIETKPSHLAEYEWSDQTDITLGTVLDVYGQIEMKMHRNDRAISALSEMVRVLGDNTTAPQYEHLMQALINAGRLKDAYSIASNAISASQPNDYIMSEHKKLFQAVAEERAKTGGKPENYDDALAKLQQQAKESRVRKLSSQRLNMEPIEGMLTTLDGKEVKLEDFKGKVVMIDFWATWCGPCVKSMPSLQEVYDKYRNNDKVQILVVNVWERTKERKEVAGKFIESSKYTFPVFLDLEDDVVKKFGVTGIPTKFFLDQQGRVQYKDVGFKNADEFKEYASSIIDLMLSDAFYQ